MEVLERIEGVRGWRAGRGSVGLVPTMGFLHDGHLALVRRAASENDATAASVFVNPSQFGPGEDLRAYPRDLARDLEMLSGAGCAMAFVPTVEEMYPPGFQTWVEVGAVATFQDITKIQSMEERIRREIYSQGHVAKFTFGDICGGNPVFTRAIDLARPVKERACAQKRWRSQLVR